jgi:hypothetical protein
VHTVGALTEQRVAEATHVFASSIHVVAQHRS